MFINFWLKKKLVIPNFLTTERVYKNKKVFENKNSRIFKYYKECVIVNKTKLKTKLELPKGIYLCLYSQ